MAGETELPIVLCGYVYAKLLNPANEANAAPVLVFDGNLAVLSAAVANYSRPPWTVVSSGTYPCGGDVPPPPPIVSSPPPPPPPPPPPTCPDGQHWDATAGACVPDDSGGGDNPSPGPTGGGGGDEIAILIQVLTLYLDQIIATVGKCCGGSGGSNPGGASDECCSAIAGALSAIALAIDQLAAAARGGAGPGQGAPDFTSLVQALKAISDALAAWDPLRAAVLEYLAQLAERLAQPGDADCICKQLTRLAARADRESAADDGTIAALAGLDANIETLWNLVGAQET